MGNIRTDREYGNELENDIRLYVLTAMAEMIDDMTRAGPIYGQLLLSPEEQAAKQAAMKRAAMEAPNAIQ